MFPELNKFLMLLELKFFWIFITNKILNIGLEVIFRIHL